MLSRCRAFVVAQTEAQNRSLMRLAERAGFGLIGTAFGRHAVAVEGERSEIVFFFVHYMLPDSAMTAIIRRIRQSANDAVRFAPIFLVIQDCPYETILKYVRLGYDDVIVLPEKREALVGRILAQLNCEQLYFETGDYLGPDRRRMDYAESPVDPRRRPETPHTRLHINRTIEEGARVLRFEIVGKRPDAPQAMRSHGARGANVAGHA
mgnify:CR=1 FL=1